MRNPFKRGENEIVESVDSASGIDEDNLASEDSVSSDDSLPDMTTDSPAPVLRSRKEERMRRRRKKRLVVGGVSAAVALLVIAGVGGGIAYNQSQKMITPQATEVITESDTENPCMKMKPLNCQVTWQDNDTVKRGALISQSIPAGKKVYKGTAIELVYSNGPESAVIPSIIGAPLDEVKQRLYELGLNVDEVKVVESAGKAENIVLSASVKEGDTVPNGTQVTLEVSNGQIALPDWTGKTREFVDAEAKKLGVEVKFKEEESEQTPGTVLSQTPKPGEVKSATEVVVTVAKAFASKDVKVPDVVGKSETDAQSELAAAGFRHIKTVVVKNTEVTEKQVTQVVPGVGQTAKSEENIVLIVSEPAE